MLASSSSTASSSSSGYAGGGDAMVINLPVNTADANSIQQQNQLALNNTNSNLTFGTVNTNLNASSSMTFNNGDAGQCFVSALLPYVKSFAYTWFHLQAAKRKHFKNEDKRMSYEEELTLKNQLMNEQPSVKIKWAARLLMKLRKDIQKMSQKDLVDIITNVNGANSFANEAQASNKCVISNPDMKGKMRRIDCLRQSDKVWRLDLVMVVLFKGMPLESSDGERIDKLPECSCPQLCINPNHAMINVRDLEIYLANYINNSNTAQIVNRSTNDVKLYYSKNIVSSSVFSTQEFLSLSEYSIIAGANESDIKNSLSFVASNTHYLEGNDDMDMPANVAANMAHNQANSDVDDKDYIRAIINNTTSMNTAVGNDFNEQDKPKLAVEVDASSGANASASTENHLPLPKTKKLKVIGGSGSGTDIKSNIKINELIEQMNYQKQNDTTITKCDEPEQLPAVTSVGNNFVNHQHNTDQSLSVTNKLMPNIDFEISLENNKLDADTSHGSKQTKKGTQKGKKNTKIGIETSGEAAVVNVKVEENNSPTKATIKRRRSSQKAAGENEDVDTSAKTSKSKPAASKKQPKVGKDSPFKTRKIKNDETVDASKTGQPQTGHILQFSETNLHSIEDQSSCSTSSQQDEEIKELLMKKNNTTSNNYQPIIQQQQQQQQDTHKIVQSTEQNGQRLVDSSSAAMANEQKLTKEQTAALSKQNTIRAMINSPSLILAQQQRNFQPVLNLSDSQNGSKISADELKELIQREKQTTTDLFIQFLKCQEDHMNSSNSQSSQNDVIFNELTNSTTMLLNNSNFMQQQQQQQHHQQLQQQLKSTTPVFELLMSPLFNTILPSSSSSSGSCSNSSTASTSTASNSTTTNGQNQPLICGSLNQFNSVHNVASAAAAALSAAISFNKTPSSSPTIIDSLKHTSNGSSFKRTKETKNSTGKNIKNTISGSQSNNNGQLKLNNINSSLINALRFDSNGNLDELIGLTGGSIVAANDANGQQILLNKATTSTASSTPSDGKSSQKLIMFNPTTGGSIQIRSGSQTPRAVDEANMDEDDMHDSTLNGKHVTVGANSTRTGQMANSTSSPPPPPSIASSVVINSSSITAPSPTKLLQFYPYAQGSMSHVMHRPIPIIQKADAAMSSILSTNTNTNSQSGSDLKLPCTTPKNETTLSSHSNNPNSKTPSELSELIKISQQQQQQLFSTLRSNSANNNSPLMFSINSNGINYNSNNSNGATNINNGLNLTMNQSNINNLMSSFSSNTANLFVNYPNISPANGMNGALIGGNGNASPTSSLFPSITSLFQSPIGTPRVTPTPQQFAAYLFNDDQFHSLIFPPTSLSNNSNGATNSNSNEAHLIDNIVLTNNNNNSTTSQQNNNSTNAAATNLNQSSSDLSPLFQNLISNNGLLNHTPSNDLLKNNPQINQPNENVSSKPNMLVSTNN